MRYLVAAFTLTGLIVSGPAWAQETHDDSASRPATATSWGDTGLWFVPTGEVLRSRGWSFSLYRTELDFNEGFTDVVYFPATLAVGVGDRAEIFGAFRTITRIDRDVRPLFLPSTKGAGLVNEYPFVREVFTGNDVGDLLVGAKLNLFSEHRNWPMALALRGTVKVPTADYGTGVGTGEYDYFADVIASKEIGRRLELAGFGGVALRGDPDEVSLSNGIRWGLGAAFGARTNLRFTAELHGENTFDETVAATPRIIAGFPGSPFITGLESPVNAAVGLTWQHSSGLFLGAGLNYRFGIEERGDVFPEFGETPGDAIGVQFRLGFHPGVRVYVPPAPRAEAAPPAPAPVAAAPSKPAPPAPAANRLPTLKAECDPCRVQVGGSVAIRANAQDPDSDTLSYLWSTPAGTTADPRAAATRWTAETVPGVVTLTVTANDGRGGVASSAVKIEVFRPGIAFEDVQFDLDMSVLRPDAIIVLDQAVRTLTENGGINLIIEGHASEEATAEYNLALGDRRAMAVRDYLVGRGIAAARLSTVTYGEERPRYSNAQEATRRLNRRAALVIRP
ncbi:MAG: pal 2 [Acidobacteria bacterium]|nr:pal 2 [Acidobacteriota bacterium]